jgi:preprotein translocase subunit SecD
MQHFPLWKRILVIGLCLAGFALGVPNLFYNRVEAHNDAVTVLERDGAVTDAQSAAMAGWPAWMPSGLVNLGLDLRGGAHLLAEVHLAEVYKARMDGLWPELRKALADERQVIGSIRRVPSTPDVLKIQIGNADQIARAVEVARALARPVVSMTGVGSSDIEVTGTGETHTVKLSAAEQTATDPTIMRQGADRILIEVPGIGSAAELKGLIGTTAKLTFHQVVGRAASAEQRPGPGQEILPDANDKTAFYILDSLPVVTGDELTDARPDSDQNGMPAVAFRFNATGARAFGDYTANHIGEPFAIVLDGKVISAPVIQTHIAGGSGVITGRFSVQQATDLALLLRAGALPAGMTFLEERTIGPELGADSIQAGMIASAIGFAAVVVFMIASYGLFGFFASVALAINVIFIIAFMSLIGATLTMPGIAGIVLTMGTAVDANVLIFERVREELRRGIAPVRAFDIGYDKAMSAIVESSVSPERCEITAV